MLLSWFSPRFGPLLWPEHRSERFRPTQSQLQMSKRPHIETPASLHSPACYRRPHLAQGISDDHGFLRSLQMAAHDPRMPPSDRETSAISRRLRPGASASHGSCGPGGAPGSNRRHRSRCRRRDNHSHNSHKDSPSRSVGRRETKPEAYAETATIETMVTKPAAVKSAAMKSAAVKSATMKSAMAAARRRNRRRGQSHRCGGQQYDHCFAQHHQTPSNVLCPTDEIHRLDRIVSIGDFYPFKIPLNFPRPVRHPPEPQPICFRPFLKRKPFATRRILRRFPSLRPVQAPRRGSRAPARR